MTNKKTSRTEGIFTIYQLRQGESTRDFRFMPYEYLEKKGFSVCEENYRRIYTAPIDETTCTPDAIMTKFNIFIPMDFKGHSLSVSDIVTLAADGETKAYYVDSFDFKEIVFDETCVVCE